MYPVRKRRIRQLIIDVFQIFISGNKHRAISKIVRHSVWYIDVIKKAPSAQVISVPEVSQFIKINPIFADGTIPRFCFSARAAISVCTAFINHRPISKAAFSAYEKPIIDKTPCAQEIRI